MTRFRAPSSDSEDDSISSLEDQQPARATLRVGYQAPEDSSDEGDDIYPEIDDSRDYDELDTEEQRADPTVLPWAREIGVAPQRMHVMQSTLFRQPEEAAALREVTKAPSRRLLLQGPRSSLNRKHRRDSDGEGHRAESRPVCCI